MSDSNRGMTVSREMPASTFNGYTMLLIMLGLTAIGGWCIAALKGGADPVLVLPLALCILFFVLVLAGFYMVQPNQAYVITQFGAYRGTDRTQGLRWVWFWQGRRKINVRAHNVHSERVKINDLRGNPIEVACNVVWRVQDTAQASFDVDDYREFVNIQIEAGLRTVGARHPYDDMSDDDKTTLRGSADVISSELQAELNDRLKVAGIIVDEAGLTHLAYAPEIAGAMLRRQQAEAVIAARTKLVMGAVGMVEDALVKLAEDGIVDLDDERKAAMVSNLMVVLCGDREAQPVVNTGTLYQ
ncbi:SPFH domain-containing protein [Altererythrobacter sp. CC-YST694]|uniref:SPFH domain-containing protein n=1 Tax=Altererythrobacter sp. CC-YST694 TaxID=2755038 RepID=UPI001D006678|nr:SPFH domain-containing protein [Altererythrobacter sp. CC-YST694]MCB5425543.1 SPFH domain-containing protein [Altererythrobacter sp. CC-YST694]